MELNSISLHVVHFVLRDRRLRGQQGRRPDEYRVYAAAYSAVGFILQSRTTGTLLDAISCVSEMWCAGVGPMTDVYDEAGSRSGPDQRRDSV